MMGSARKWFHRSLFRRRHIDPALLCVATAGILLPFNIGAGLFGFFIAIGYYLIVFRPRTSVPIDRVYAIAAAIFAGGSLAISVANGSLPNDWRWASYPGYYLAVLPIAAGLCLVRDPLRQFVTGARLGIAILAIWTVVVLLVGQARYGFNTNAANAAFAISFVAVIARIEVNSPARFFPNQLAWFYLALLPVLATGTRAVLPVFLVATLIDLAGLAKSRLGGSGHIPQNRRAMLAAFLAIILLTGGLLAPNIYQRAMSTIDEIQNIEADPDPNNGGMTIRLAQWRSAHQVIGDNFWLGIGGIATKDALVANSPQEFRTELSRYQFAHNAVLDEWMQRGILGVILTGGFFIFCFGRVYRHGTRSMQTSVVLLTILTISFGMLHYLLLVDRHVALYALYFLFMTTAIQRQSNRDQSGLGPQ